MNPRMPNEEERKKLQKMSRFYKVFPIYGLILLGAFFLVERLLEKNPAIQIVITTFMLLVMIYMLLSFALLKRCPRCSAWGSPVLGGNCTRCGLLLNPNHKES